MGVIANNLDQKQHSDYRPTKRIVCELLCRCLDGWFGKRCEKRKVGRLESSDGTFLYGVFSLSMASYDTYCV